MKRFEYSLLSSELKKEKLKLQKINLSFSKINKFYS